MNLITGYYGEDHVTAMEDAIWHRGIWNKDCIVAFGENMKANIISNNEIQVRSGVISMQGRFSVIPPNTYDSLTINNGTIGENRIDLIVCHYEKNADTQVESMNLKVIQGIPSADTPTVPSYTEGNIDNGDLIAEVPVFQVNIKGITVESVDTVIDVEQSFTDRSANLLFEGATQTGNITLIDSIFNYKFLVFSISAQTNNAPYGYSLMPVIKDRNDTYQIFQGAGALSDTNERHEYATYVAGITPIENGTIFQIVKPVMNIIHTSGSNHGGGTIYYIREVWGIR